MIFCRSLQIAVQRGQVRVHVLDEARVDRDRDVVVEQRRLERIAELPHVLVEHVALDVGVQRRRERARELAVAAPERVEHGVAVRLHGRRAILVVRRGVEPHLLARGQRDLRERQVGIREHRVHGACGLREHAGTGHDLLLAWRERVRRGAQDVVEEHAVLGEARLPGEEAFDRRTSHRQQFRPHVGGGGLQARVHLDRLLLHLLVARIARVLVAQRRRVDVGAFELAVDFLPVIQRREQRRSRFAQLALPARQFRDLLVQGLLRGDPRRLVGIETGQVPFVTLRNLSALDRVGRTGSDQCPHDHRRES